jgi:hypothetical protein
MTGLSPIACMASYPEKSGPNVRGEAWLDRATDDPCAFGRQIYCFQRRHDIEYASKGLGGQCRKYA